VCPGKKKEDRGLEQLKLYEDWADTFARTSSKTGRRIKVQKIALLGKKDLSKWRSARPARGQQDSVARRKGHQAAKGEKKSWGQGVA